MLNIMMLIFNLYSLKYIYLAKNEILHYICFKLFVFDICNKCDNYTLMHLIIFTGSVAHLNTLSPILFCHPQVAGTYGSYIAGPGEIIKLQQHAKCCPGIYSIDLH